MRYLLVSRQHHAGHGGIGTYVSRFIHAARERCWHVELMTQPGTDWPRCERVHEVRTADMDAGFDALLPALRRMHVVRPYRYALWSLAVAKRLLTMSGEFDAIEFVDCQAEGLAALGCPRVRQRHGRARFIVHAHTPMFVEESINRADAGLFGRSRYHDWERRALRLADGVIVTARNLQLALSEACDASVIPYPIADEDKSARPEFKREQRVVLIGSIQPRKGVDVWARSLNQVLRANPRVSAWLVGPDTPTAPDGLSMAAYAQRLMNERLRERFHWTGSLNHDRVRALIADSSLVVVPSRLESFSFVAAEALLAGTPVVVSNETGIGEHVPSLPRVAVEDIDALASAQNHALADTCQASRHAAVCRDEMLRSCEPLRVMRMREDYINGLTHSRKHDQADVDTIEEMQSFVSSVDAELDASTASMGSAASKAIS